MSDNHNEYRPDNDAPGSDHFVEAVANEIGRLGTKSDEDFLARVTEQLRCKDNTVVQLPKKNNQVKAIILSMAALVTISLIALVLVNNTKTPSTDDTASAKTPQPVENIVAIKPTVPTHKIERKPPESEAPSKVSDQSIIRLQKQVAQADKVALKGAALMANNDFQGAVDQYTKALDLLPDGQITTKRRELYTKHYANSATMLARSYADSARYNEAIQIIETVLSPSITPNNQQARQLLSQLNDPQIYSPALTPDHLARVQRVKDSLQSGQDYREYGNFTRAEREYHKALVDDRYNSAARRSLEQVERERIEYYQAARDHTRANFLRKVEQGWECPIPQSLLLETPSEGERYSNIGNNSFASPFDQPFSTFSIDVDTASYANIRRMIQSGNIVPENAVRIEEMINYFTYNYPQPKGNQPFGFATEIARCPWNQNHQLLRVGIKAKEVAKVNRPAANLVFLVDVSGSMSDYRKLPLVKKSLNLLVEEMTSTDKISIVVYAGSEGLCLEPTDGNQKQKITEALNNLQSGGSTNGCAGINLAYRLAAENHIKDGINRVILCTDGDFNVGMTGDQQLIDLVKQNAQTGTFLTVLGYGEGNLNDAMLEEITNQGNGTYSYIDSQREARKVLLQELMSTLVTVASDVKIQVEFNPNKVQHYRLIGYTNRALAAKDFNDDKVDAGEVGAGHSVTALYEIVPPGAASPINPEQPATKYQKVKQPKNTEVLNSSELCTIKLRYKPINKTDSLLIEQPIVENKPIKDWKKASTDYQWTAATAMWGMKLRKSPYLKENSINTIIKQLTENGKGSDPYGRRTEMISLIELTRTN